MESIKNLLEIMAKLRDPHTGCPWDQQQDFSSIAPYTVEEAYEVADAIAREDLDGLREELGDLLFQVAFHARMAEEQGAFDFDAVATGICDKMIRRHPHVFGTAREREKGPQKGSWQKIKAAERADREVHSSALDGVARALPALKRAEKLGKRAAAVGFDWPDPSGPGDKIDEELGELALAREAGDEENMLEELGDLLFAIVNLARHLRIDPEQALSGANRKFERRFRSMEQEIIAAGQAIQDLDLETLESHWQSAKGRRS
ncbi:MAG: nucleoside triphosphate pyrophosphohydrolase [Proteobacteria bacterium]|nr:nucleoside triphosphate pyrophosphohydrolase [Pseudomonadota bacterium]